MISLLIGLLILAIIFYVVYLVLQQIALPPTIKQIVYIILGLVFLLILLDQLGIYHFSLR